jgi:hypothetical protein
MSSRIASELSVKLIETHEAEQTPMGSGYAPCSGWVISTETLRSLVPNELGALEAALDEGGLTLNDLAREVSIEEPSPPIAQALIAVQKAFERATTFDGQHLELELFEYNLDLGERYDELPGGANWLVSGMTQLTAAGRKFQDRIRYERWTQFG